MKKGGSVTPVEPATPVWAGPESSADNGGVTFSLLSRFLVCRERYRLLVVEGLKPQERFNHRLEFGNMWHVCEEALAGNNGSLESLREYAIELVGKYPHDRQEIDKWYEVCKVQFPLYVKYWDRHFHSRKRLPLLQEQVFKVRYSLPSGRKVYLRGKWDSVDLVGKGVWLVENKTKSRIDQVQIQRQLAFDLQTMLYVVALEAPEGLASYATNGRHPLAGVRYNVVKRSEHRLGKNESCKDFAARVGEIIETYPADWFMRWEVTLTPGDVSSFQRRCLDPILEQLCDWWEQVETYSLENLWGKHHWIYPAGVYNPLLEGSPTDLDSYIYSGQDAGLERTRELFPELASE
jgi:hypothetical protein